MKSINLFKPNEGTRSMITSLDSQSKRGNEQEPIDKQRRTLIGGALAALLSSSGRVRPPDNLSLTVVNLNDGSYSKTTIYPIFGIPGSIDQNRPIGTFYVQFAGNLCAYVSCLSPMGRVGITWKELSN
jgi:hypothetical protein